jgi:hypothetical protein
MLSREAAMDWTEAFPGDLFYEKRNPLLWFAVRATRDGRVLAVDAMDPEWPYAPRVASPEFPGLVEAIEACKALLG